MPAYFDHNATTPLHPAAREAWLRASEKHWHNPSSLYREAGFASQALESARERLGDLLGAEAERIVFTSGATESNNTLFAGLARCLPPDACVAISAIEHPCVREAARAWLGRARVVEIPVDAEGVVQPDVLKRLLLEKQPALVSIMAANNESGVLQPWPELLKMCREHGARFHSDAAQWIGKLDASSLGTCDYLTGSAHKFGGPKGTGFLVLADEAESFPLLLGGPQESSRRAGTENYPGIEAMVTALEVITPRLSEVAQTQTALRDAFAASMKQAFPDLRIISEGAPRLWNTVLMVMPEHSNLKWLTRMSRAGFAISTGSACSSGKEGSSVVVQALGTDWEELKRVVRVSGGWDSTAEDWSALAEAFIEVAKGL
ncbi:cysteine desulfurase family protein [Brevifollis gellanilyticus]|uniref:cysteine desulfurase n=1 Tax=Brevifollis gellanilyticus TaxID=748831 RepID=A0A512MBR0_9BACT|nr:cysteine desulfurase family protein [Brevifollis gellanilyticus]GEP44172.1 cysteine desulfurase [Brevifollis gellanilyticus]